MLRRFFRRFGRSQTLDPTPQPNQLHKVGRWTLGRFDRPPTEDPNGSGRLWYHARAFESAEASRLTEAHWSGAVDRPINEDLEENLPTMRLRATHESHNNSSVEGLILSHTLAVVGKRGPSLDIHCDGPGGDAWSHAAEQIWQEWAKQSDASGKLELHARMKQWNRSGWTCGEWIDQLITKRTAPGPVKLRLLSIPPQRLQSPVEWFGKPNRVLGIRQNEFREPHSYWIAHSFDGFGGGQELPARDVLHQFNQLEPEQARGIPWMNTGLPTAADIRDYDDQVMDAARAAADNALYAYTDHPDAEFVPTNAVVEVRRRSLRHMAPGWRLAQNQANQPAATYKEHRHERMGDLGRGQGVPSMVVRLDARDHNYSSARFDYSLLAESADHCRTMLYEPSLVTLVKLVLMEAMFAGALAPPPGTWTAQWTWPRMPQIDELKAAEGEKRKMLNGTLSFSAACAANGQRAEDVARQRQRDNEMLAVHGLPPIVADLSGEANPDDSNEDDNVPKK